MTEKITNNSSDMFGLGGEETDWRGIPIEKKESYDPEKSAREKKMKEIKETTKATDDARMVNHKANLDAEGAD